MNAKDKISDLPPKKYYVIIKAIKKKGGKK